MNLSKDVNLKTGEKWILQLCHSYGAPFDDVARQWKVLFDETGYKVLTVFLTGEPNEQVVDLVGGEVQFLGYRSKDIKGFKRAPIKDVRKLHGEYNFDLAIAHRYKPTYIATHVKGLKVYGVAHAYGVFDRFWRRRYVQSCKERLTLIGVSNAIRGDVRESLPKFPQEKILTLYNRVNVEKLQKGQVDRKQAREFLGLPQDAYVLGNVGRLHPDKDQRTLIAGFAKALPDMKDSLLVIIGEGRLEQELRQQAVDLGVSEKVLFPGRVNDAWRYFKAFDVFVLTSNYEPFGMVLLEAMVAGVPVVSSDVGGAPEVLGETGELFQLGDQEDLAETLVGFRVAATQANGMRRVQEYFSDSSAKIAFSALLEHGG